MKKLLLAATCFVGFSFSQAILADTLIDDPLHGWCAAGCTDNGTNTPIPSLNQTFGFFASPANTGTLILTFLIPNNDAQPGSITVTGTSSGTATPHAGTWISDDLEDFLGLVNASPANPIGAYLPSTQALDPGATGFIVYTVNVGTYSLPVPGAGTPPDRFQVTGFTAPVGSYAVADLTVTGEAVRYVTTANSAALFVTGVQQVPAPLAGAGLPGLILAGGGLLAWWRRRQKTA